MKHFFLLLIITASLPPIASGQITEAKKLEPRKTIGKNESLGAYVELYYRIGEEEDTTFVLMYQNKNYKTIVDIESITFFGGMDVIDKLYSYMTSVFLDENKKNKDYKVHFALGDKDVIVSNERTMGNNWVRFWTSDGYFVLNEKQVNKLFGKDK